MVYVKKLHLIFHPYIYNFYKTYYVLIFIKIQYFD